MLKVSFSPLRMVFVINCQGLRFNFGICHCLQLRWYYSQDFLKKLLFSEAAYSDVRGANEPVSYDDNPYQEVESRGQAGVQMDNPYANYDEEAPTVIIPVLAVHLTHVLNWL